MELHGLVEDGGMAYVNINYHLENQGSAGGGLLVVISNSFSGSGKVLASGANGTLAEANYNGRGVYSVCTGAGGGGISLLLCLNTTEVESIESKAIGGIKASRFEVF